MPSTQSDEHIAHICRWIDGQIDLQINKDGEREREWRKRSEGERRGK